MTRLLIRDGALVQRGGALLTVPAGGAEDCECCGCICHEDLADSYVVVAPCMSVFEGDDCDGVATWSVTVSRPLWSESMQRSVDPPDDTVGDCAWYGEAAGCPVMVWLSDADGQCGWKTSISDPKLTGSSPVGTYPGYLFGGSVEILEEEGI